MEVAVPDEVLQVQQISFALPPASQVRTSTPRRCRDSVDVLLEEPAALQPQQPVRTTRHTHDNVLAPIVGPGARHAYRMGHEIPLDYNNDTIEHHRYTISVQNHM